MTVYGHQRPRIHTGPSFTSSPGREAIELARLGGLILDPWQEFVLEQSLGEKGTGKDRLWAARQVGLVVPRQNGKGSILEARELFGLFLEPRERVILHSAHEFKTAHEGFMRIQQCIEHSEDLSKKVDKIVTSHGHEGIKLKDGSRLLFVARSNTSGRGFTGDCIVLDEAFNLSQSAVNSLIPTLNARPNPQIWYTSSAGLLNSEELTRIRMMGRRGEAESLLYMEWSMEEDGDPDDERNWAMANPALGYRVTLDGLRGTRAAMSPEGFAREILGVWDENTIQQMIDARIWEMMGDANSRPGSELVFAVDCTPDRSSASIASAGRRSDGRLHVKIVAHKPGTDWVLERLLDLRDRYKPTAIVLDPSGPAGSFKAELAEMDIEAKEVSGREMAQACGAFHSDVLNDRIRHCKQDNLTLALRQARTRPLGEAWAWTRRDSAGDICPLVAATLAAHGFREGGGKKNARPWALFD